MKQIELDVKLSISSLNGVYKHLVDIFLMHTGWEMVGEGTKGAVWVNKESYATVVTLFEPCIEKDGQLVPITWEEEEEIEDEEGAFLMVKKIAAYEGIHGEEMIPYPLHPIYYA